MQEKHKISIRFLGAAGTVTGSKHLLQTPEMQILIDCGLYQGIKSLREKNWAPFPVDAGTIHLVLITHAHLDHVGYLPLLIKHGFRGKILMTAPTRDLAEIILKDSAMIQEEDAMYANEEGFSKHHPALPLYTLEDVEAVLPYMEIVEEGTWIKLSANISCRFRRNSHLLGSCFIEMQCFGKRIIFSGDVGNNRNAILPPPSIPDEADYLIMESTYGNRTHDPEPATDQLAQIINQAMEKKGHLLIPSFAVGRAQLIMYLIRQLRSDRKIPLEIPIFMDSPMGAAATDVHCRYPGWQRISPDQCSNITKGIRIIQDFKDTMRVSRTKEQKIVIAASGMLTGGRALHYLKYYLGENRHTILLVGHQVEGTRGSQLLNGAQELKLHGAYFKVKAEIAEISSLSSHADQAEMLAWIKAIPGGLKKIFLVHGEAEARDVFRVKLQDELGIPVELPEEGDSYVLD